jgi:cytochrome c biogenesis protein CcmG/thiol:disulfide interchange protein DsbE
MESSQSSQNKEARQGRSPAWLAAGAIALLVLGLLGYGLVSRPAGALQVGNPVPDFQLTTFDGGQLSLDAQRGKVVVVNFYASWCSPCQEEAADVEEAWREYRDQDVQFVGIAYKDAESKAQAFLAEFDVSYPSAVDPGSRIARAYGVTGVPETFIIDQEGLLVRHVIGPVSQAQLSLELDPLLSGSE